MLIESVSVISEYSEISCLLPQSCKRASYTGIREIAVKVKEEPVFPGASLNRSRLDLGNIESVKNKMSEAVIQ